MEKKLFEALIKKKLEEKSVSSLISADGVSLTSKGDNYLSSIFRYRLDIVLNSGEKSVKHVILKTLPESENEKKFVIHHSFFKNEIEVYSKMLINMERLMEEFEDRRDRLWCDIIHFRPYELVVIEDLKDSNFVMMNRRECLDYDHSVLVMRTLGRLHAMSRILVTRKILTQNDFGQLPFTTDLMMHILFSSGLKVLEEAVTESWGAEWKHLPKHIRKAKEQLFEVIGGIIKFDESRFNVLNHGDCWTNNLFFKHIEGTKIPCEIRYIDFQMTHFNSFAWDLTYFLYNSILPEMRHSKYNELLSIYQQSLKDNLVFFNYTLDDIPTMNDVICEMNRIKFYGLCQLVSVHPITVSDGNMYDVEKILNNLENPGLGIDKEMYNSPRYKDGMVKDLQMFIDEGII